MTKLLLQLTWCKMVKCPSILLAMKWMYFVHVNNIVTVFQIYKVYFPFIFVAWLFYILIVLDGISSNDLFQDFFLQNAVNGSIQKVFCRALFIFDRPVFELFVLYRGLCGMSLSVVALNLSSSFSVQFLHFLLERYWMVAFSLYLISICLTFISQRPSITWVNLSFDLELNLPKLNLVSLQPQFHVESTFE